jgi:hypothetical protein
MLSEIRIQHPSAKMYKHDIPLALLLSVSSHNQTPYSKTKYNQHYHHNCTRSSGNCSFCKSTFITNENTDFKKGPSEETSIDVVILRKNTGGLRLHNLSPSLSRSI